MIIKNQIILSGTTVSGHAFNYDMIETALDHAAARSLRNSLFGELFIDSRLQSDATEEIDFTNIAVSVKNLKYDKATKKVTADLEVMNTPAGNKLRGYLISKNPTKTFGVSMRAVGDDEQLTNDNFNHIVAFDIIESKYLISQDRVIRPENIIRKEI